LNMFVAIASVIIGFYLSMLVAIASRWSLKQWPQA
jgi:hypothetical protein